MGRAAKAPGLLGWCSLRMGASLAQDTASISSQALLAHLLPCPERHLLLQAAPSSTAPLQPLKCAASHGAQVCRVIRWLMAPNPAQRPTAKEVLRSDLLPATGTLILPQIPCFAC